MLGRKTGRGWYEYGKDGAAEQTAGAAGARHKPPNAVWAVPELKELLVELGARPELKPTPDAVCFVAPLGADATTTALEHGLDPERTVAVDPLFGFSKRRTLMKTPVTRKEVVEAAHAPARRRTACRYR